MTIMVKNMHTTQNKETKPHMQMPPPMNMKSGGSLVTGGPIEQYFAKEGVDPLAHAFSGKLAVHPGVHGGAMSQEEHASTVEQLSHAERKGKSVTYIHVPFCETHCLYCGFYNKYYDKDQSKIYADTLIKELHMWSGKRAQDEGPIHALYMGGGTPTALEADDLKRILLEVHKVLPLANDCEVTVEGRIHNFTKEKMEACFEGGANRFSLGVQSFNTEIRQSMKRVVDGETACRQLELLQSYNQAAVVVDLIYGFPNQTMDIWLDDIKIAQSLNLDGADCYQLNVYGFTPLAKAIAAGKLPDSASIAMQSSMFAASVDAMEKAFYRRLSMSHWARTSRERNLYNLYMKGTACSLAFGPGAGGNLGGHFYMIENDYKKWQDLVNDNVKPIAMIQKSPKHNALYRAFAESMEQGYVHFTSFEKLFAIKIQELCAPILEQWQKVGLIELRGEYMVLTLAGQFWQVNLTQILLHSLKAFFAKEV